MSDLMRAAIDAIWPDGSIWNPDPDGDLSNLLDGSADNWEIIRVFLENISDVRNPKFTTLLSDLEREFGVFTNLSLTDQQRRDQLLPIVYNRSSRNGSADVLQNALNDAGFNVQVHENSPAVDPAIFLDQNFQMIAGGAAAFAGNQDAFAARIGGELLVNGDVFTTKRIFDVVAGGTVYAGNGETAGEYTDLERVKIEYPIPISSGDWPLVFFVGGDATRNVSGELTMIDFEEIQLAQKSEFQRIILKYKPVHSWAGLIITYA